MSLRMKSDAEDGSFGLVRALGKFTSQNRMTAAERAREAQRAAGDAGGAGAGQD